MSRHSDTFHPSSDPGLTNQGFSSLFDLSLVLFGCCLVIFRRGRTWTGRLATDLSNVRNSQSDEWWSPVLHFLCEAFGDTSKQTILVEPFWMGWMGLLGSWFWDPEQGPPCSFWNSFCSSALKGAFLSWLHRIVSGGNMQSASYQNAAYHATSNVDLAEATKQIPSHGLPMFVIQFNHIESTHSPFKCSPLLQLGVLLGILLLLGAAGVLLLLQLVHSRDHLHDFFILAKIRNLLEDCTPGNLVVCF